MARVQQVNVEFLDDFDGTKAAETVTFGLDGKVFEIDLSKRNASELRRAFQPYVEVARRARSASAGGRRAGTGASSGPRKREGYDRAEVRAWAKANRIKVSARGRIANDVVDRWRAATGG